MSTEQRILVVEDERNIRLLLCRVLEGPGRQVDAADCGEAALEALAEAASDLVLLDLLLPDMDGLDVLTRALEMRPGTPVVIITAHGTVEIAVEAMKRGAADFVQKPFKPDEIRRVVQGILEHGPVTHPGMGYDGYLSEARHHIDSGHLDVALAYIRKAIGADPSRPEAFNHMGVAVHLGGQAYKAQDYFRAALALDPTYRPAQQNLDRSTSGWPRDAGRELVLGAPPEREEE